MTRVDLQRKLHNNPFRPFRIRLASNVVYDVFEPWMAMVGEDSALIVTRMRKDEYGYQTALDWRTVATSHMLEFIDLESRR